jgi:hypothetical protein
MKQRIKNSENSAHKISIEDIKIKSYKMTSDKKMHENTCHIFGS